MLIRGALVVDPSQGLEAPKDVLIDRGKIAAVEPPGTIPGEGRRVIEAQGLVLTPGLIDMHVHLREPGDEYKETIETGTRAAVQGGFTAVACMPNTEPLNENAAVTRFILDAARTAGLARVHPVAAISMGSKGEQLSEYGDQKKAGAVAVSDDGRPVMNAMIMRRALEYARTFDLPMILHCEDLDLRADGVMHEGRVSLELGLKGIPAAAEEVIIFRDLNLAWLTGGRLHIAHVSTAGSVELIRRAKAAGLPVTAETAPHYFSLTDTAVTGDSMEMIRRDKAAGIPLTAETAPHDVTRTGTAVTGYDTNAKVNPPLRPASDVTAIKEGLNDGTLDAIASDHAPHSTIEKDLEFEAADFGLIGLETSLGLSLKLVHDRVLTLTQLVAAMSTNPARILNVPGGTLAPGSVADITLIDLNRDWTVDVNTFASKSRNCPFHRWTLKGRAVMTVVNGKVVWEQSVGS